MTRICQLTSVHPLKDIRIFYKECLSLKEMGYDVHLLVPHNKEEILEGIKVHPVPKLGNRFLRIIVLPWIILFKALRVKACIYHFHDPDLIFVGMLLRLSGKKVIYDVHENFPLQVSAKQYLVKPLRVLFSVLGRMYEDMGVIFFNKVIVATESIKERFSGSIHNKIFVIKNYVNHHELKPASYSDKPGEVCYVGGISYYRGIDLMVRSIENQKVILNLAGKFHSDDYQSDIQGYEGWRNTRYWGVLNREGIKDVYERSRVGLLLLRPREGFIDSLPIKLFEYMAAGIPVLASDFPLWKKIIEDNGCGFCVDPLDIEQVKSKIHYLLNNEDEAKKMGERGRDLVISKYNWDRQKSRLYTCYEQTLGNKK